MWDFGLVFFRCKEKKIIETNFLRAGTGVLGVRLRWPNGGSPNARDIRGDREACTVADYWISTTDLSAI
jgi:hypothetical protein